MKDIPTWKLEITYSFAEMLRPELDGDYLGDELKEALRPCVDPESGQPRQVFVWLDKGQLQALELAASQWACRDVENRAKRLDWNRLAGIVGKLARTQPDGVRLLEPAAAVSVAPRQASLFD